MPSPFPGMDPYLENPDRWPAVHTGLIVNIQAALNRTLPDDLVAEIDQYVWVAEDGGDGELLGKPDLLVPEPYPPDNGSGYPTDPSGVTSPTATVTLPANKLRKNRALKITTTDGARVVTVIEILSPSNKNRGEDRDAYLSKRSEYFAARANVVEIDLLRDGDRLPMGRPRPPAADYYVLISRAGEYPSARVWSFSVRERIPVIPVPLGPATPAVPLDLQQCLAEVYQNGRFDRKLGYATPPVPPLRRDDADWAAELLATRTTSKRK